MTRSQSVTPIHLGDGHVVLIVDLDPAQLSPSQRIAFDGVRRAVGALEEAPELPSQRGGELLRSVGEGGEGRRTGERR